jgi:hypothetical protein
MPSQKAWIASQESPEVARGRTEYLLNLEVIRQSQGSTLRAVRANLETGDSNYVRVQLAGGTRSAGTCAERSFEIRADITRRAAR